MQNSPNPPILTTKLYRPPLQADHVPRERLFQQFSSWELRPLTLISAPAGYGKTTLVSSWLETLDVPVAWLSLDEADSDLFVFLTYLIAAVRTIIPNICPETSAILTASELLPERLLTSSLINELNQEERPFMLVMDDYHLIHDPSVHNFLNELLRHPPRAMHLVLIGRSDPPINLTRLRARGLVSEIRAQELRFNLRETAAFLTLILGHTIDESTASSFEEKTEGWATSLRLAALSIRQHDEDETQFLERHSGESHYIWDYLVSEVLLTLPSAVQNFLVKTSILDRLNGSLCDAVIGLDEPDCDGQAYLEWLHEINLFITPLDDKREWYRYHHLFRELLLRQLEQRLTKDEIKKLHVPASNWYAQNDFIDEAIRHSLNAGEIDQAVELLASSRHVLIDAEQWRRLEQRLSLMPRDIIEKDPRLHIIIAWLLNVQGKWQEELVALQRTETLLDQVQFPPETAVPICGEAHLLRANILGWSYDGASVLDHIEKALEMLPRQWGYAYSAACMIEGFGLVLTGDPDQAEAHLQRALVDPSIGGNPLHKSLLLFGLTGLHWMNLELQDMQLVAQRYLDHGREHQLPETIAVAQYYLGSIHYERNELNEAEKFFAAVANTRVPVTLNFQLQGICGLVLTYLALGKYERINELLNSTRALLMEIESLHLLDWLKAVQVEVDLQKKENAKAFQWMQKYDPHQPYGIHLLYIPQMTWIKSLLARGTKADLQKAGELLGQLAALASSSHIAYVRLAILPYQALLADALGNSEEALEHLAKAIHLAEPGEWLRPFVDSGSRTATLLQELRDRNGDANFIERILAAFPAQKQARPAETSLVQPLTERELEIMRLVAKQMSNKEIAASLYIAPGTVRQHLHRIYRKLDVNSRWQAVTVATELNILS